MKIKTSSIGARLKALRRRRLLSVSDVASRIGIAQSTYREWEYGRAIKGEPYEGLAKAFDVSLSEILTGHKPDLVGDLDQIVSLITRIRNNL